MLQLSTDSITPSHTTAETNAPSGSHVSPLVQNSMNESSKRSSHPQQMGLGLAGDINALVLDSNNSQQKTSQQQSRTNQTASGNQNSGTSNTNGNCAQSASTNSNMTWQQTSPSPANGNVKTIPTENSAGETMCSNFWFFKHFFFFVFQMSEVFIIHV